MVRVKILVRNFTYGDKLFGKDGEYTVDEKTARDLVYNGRAELIEGSISEEEVQIAGLSPEDFISMIKQNADEILDILEASAKNRRDESVKGFDEVELTENPTTDEQLTTDNSEGSDDSSLLSETQSDGSNDDEDASSKETEIPEGFPGREALALAGITTIEAIPIDKDTLVEIEGIGARLANQIGVKLAQG